MAAAASVTAAGVARGAPIGIPSTHGAPIGHCREECAVVGPEQLNAERQVAPEALKREDGGDGGEVLSLLLVGGSGRLVSEEKDGVGAVGAGSTSGLGSKDVASGKGGKGGGGCRLGWPER